MGLFGGNKSSSSTKITNISEDVTKSYANYADVDGPQSNVIADIRNASGVVVQSLDGGAIDRAFDYAEVNTGALLELYDNTLQELSASNQRETETAMFALNKASTLSGDQLTQQSIVKFAFILGAAAIFAFALKGK